MTKAMFAIAAALALQQVAHDFRVDRRAAAGNPPHVIEETV